MSGKLQQLLKERNDIYSKYGNEILELISENVLPAILEVMSLSEQELSKLMWVNVHQQHDHIVVSGVIKYNEGDIIADGDVKVTLDAALAAMMDKLINVAVPIELAESGTKSDIVAYFKTTADRLRREYQDAFGRVDPMDINADFDYNKLTDEQRKALLLTTASQYDKGDKLN